MSALRRGCENLLYWIQGRPCGRPPAAAVLGRQTSTTSASTTIASVPAGQPAVGLLWICSVQVSKGHEKESKPCPD
jgi:hypothetical protein